MIILYKNIRYVLLFVIVCENVCDANIAIINHVILLKSEDCTI